MGSAILRARIRDIDQLTNLPAAQFETRNHGSSCVGDTPGSWDTIRFRREPLSYQCDNYLCRRGSPHQIALIVRVLRSGLRKFLGPLPLAYFLPINPILMRIVHAVNDLLLQPFLGMGSGYLQRRNPVNHIDREVETVHLIENCQLQRRIDVAFLLVSAHMEVGVVRSPVRQLVDQ